jgi:hypothetical protein
MRHGPIWSGSRRQISFILKLTNFGRREGLIHTKDVLASALREAASNSVSISHASDPQIDIPIRAAARSEGPAHAHTARLSREMSCEQRGEFMTTESAADFKTVGSRSPLEAHARISEAMSALTVDVRFASGSIAAASSKTDLINSTSSGSKTDLVMAASSQKQTFTAIIPILHFRAYN